MSLIPFRRGWLWEPWDNVEGFWGELPEIKTADFIPPFDVYEKDNKIIVETSIAGIDPQKVDISIDENNILTIKGKSEKKTEVEEKDYYRHEVKYGSFYRTVALPSKVKENSAVASYENGVLKIEIPKVFEPKKEKKIKIEIKK